MRHPASEKLEIIRLVEQSHLPVRRTLDRLGVSRPSNRAKVTLAEPLCRAADRLDPPRMPRPCGGHGSRAPASDPAILCDLLQPGPHAPIAEQGLPDPPAHSSARNDRRRADPRRPASSLRPNVVSGTDRLRIKDIGVLSPIALCGLSSLYIRFGNAHGTEFRYRHQGTRTPAYPMTTSSRVLPDSGSAPLCLPSATERQTGVIY